MKKIIFALIFCFSSVAFSSGNSPLIGTWERCASVGKLKLGSEKYTFTFDQDGKMTLRTDLYLYPGCKLGAFQGQMVYGSFSLVGSNQLSIVYKQEGAGIFYSKKIMSGMAPLFCDNYGSDVTLNTWRTDCSAYFNGRFELGTEFGPFDFVVSDENDKLHFPDFGEGVEENYQRIK